MAGAAGFEHSERPTEVLEGRLRHFDTLEGGHLEVRGRCADSQRHLHHFEGAANEP